MDVNWKALLDEAKHLLIEAQTQTRVQPSLHQNLCPPERDGFFDLGSQFLVAKNITVFSAWLSIKCTEATTGYADIAVVDVTIDYIGHHLIGVETESAMVGERCQRIEVRLFPQYEGLFLCQPFTVPSFFGYRIQHINCPILYAGGDKLDSDDSLGALGG